MRMGRRSAAAPRLVVYFAGGRATRVFRRGTVLFEVVQEVFTVGKGRESVEAGFQEFVRVENVPGVEEARVDGRSVRSDEVGRETVLRVYGGALFLQEAMDFEPV